MFHDREDAGRKLVPLLADYRRDPNAVVLGIPRGGVVVAAIVARELALPLDIVVAAKVGAPQNPEYAIGAVAPDGEVTANPEAGYSEDEVREAAVPALRLVAQRLETLRQGMEPLNMRGRTALVVDDGLATGLTVTVACDYLRRVQAGRIVVAVPVASSSAVHRVREHADDVVVVEVPPGFSAVGQFYDVFGQTTDAEVRELLTATQSQR